MQSLTEKDEHRKRVLRTVFEIANGSENYGVSPDKVREEAHLGAWPVEYLNELAQYLIQEGLLRNFDVANLGLTHKGIKLVEAEIRAKK